ncbi:MAG: hypothetical protein P8M34_07290 [Saprospiraceae bacterium]|nr:hypothetical protein [Saprospiraceae bacterium]
MNRLILFLFVACIMACGGSATGPKFDTSGYNTENVGSGAQIAEFKDANGWLLNKGTLLGGVKNGTWTTYYENSNKIQTLTSFLNGRKNGPEITLNDRGQIESVTEFKNDQFHGLVGKYKFGRPTDETNYKDGKMEGTFALYDSQGKLQRKGTLKNGQYHGKLQYFDDTGVVTMEYEYENGEKISGGIIEGASAE